MGTVHGATVRLRTMTVLCVSPVTVTLMARLAHPLTAATVVIIVQRIVRVPDVICLSIPYIEISTLITLLRI